MAPKSLLDVRKSLEAARERTDHLVVALRKEDQEPRWGLGEKCTKAADDLTTILRANELPSEFKVAVIGRFKAGKSAFVN